MSRSRFEIVSAAMVLLLAAGSAVRASIVSSGAVDPDPNTTTPSSILSVGNTDNSSGTVLVDGGSTLFSGYGYIGAGMNSTGSVQLYGAGSTWQDGELDVGYLGDGTLSIQNGAGVTAGTGTIAFSAGTTGMATVDGTDSTWQIGDEIRVGDGGDGKLFIKNGGKVSNGLSYIGFNTTSISSASVDGSGSSWTNNNFLIIGSSGSGTLTITNQGVVTNTYAFLGSDAKSAGVVSVSGNGSMWNNDGDLSVGDQGDGKLDIKDHGVVTNHDGYIAQEAQSTGTVTVDGAGSQWNNSGTLNVGFQGAATLKIMNGGVVSAASSTAGDAGGSADITVDGAGSKWTNTDEFTLFSSGNMVGQDASSLLIDHGGKVTANNAHISSSDGATANIFVDGAGSTLDVTSSLYLADSGKANVNISQGGKVSSTFTYVGNAAGAEGDVFLIDSGSQLKSTTTLEVGASGTGSVYISGGANVDAKDTFIGYGAGSSGSVTITDAKSKWTNNGSLHVGDSGDGMLEVQRGGTMMNNFETIIGEGAGQTGVVTVQDVGSQWTNETYMVVGDSGQGTLNITNGAKLTLVGMVGAANTMTIAQQAGSTGTVNLDGILNLDDSNVSFGAGTAAFNFNGGVLENGNILSFDLDQKGGTLRPDTSDQTKNMNIYGNYTLEAAGTYEVTLDGQDTDPAFNAGQLHVTGTAALSGKLRLDLIGSAVPGPSTSFIILTADAGVSGQFSSVSNGLGSFDTVTYNPTNVVVSDFRLALTAKNVTPSEPTVDLLGGTSTIGGVTTTFNGGEQGVINTQYQVAPAGTLPHNIPLDFVPAGDSLQSWDFAYLGDTITLNGVTVTFKYDDSTLTPAEEQALGIYHYHDDTWTLLQGVIDSVNNTITVDVPGFSTFYLVEAPTAPTPSSVPEPASAAMFATLALAAMRRRPRTRK